MINEELRFLRSQGTLSVDSHAIDATSRTTCCELLETWGELNKFYP